MSSLAIGWLSKDKLIEQDLAKLLKEVMATDYKVLGNDSQGVLICLEL